MNQLDPLLLSLMMITMAMVGLCLGSFSSAIAYRMSRGESWIFIHDSVSGKRMPARSGCPVCHHQLAAIDLVPLLSWVFSGGKCRYCSSVISIRYPVIELTGAIWMVLCYLTGCGIVSLTIFSITLPFSLAFLLVVFSKLRPSFLVSGLFFLNILIFLYAMSFGNETI